MKSRRKKPASTPASARLVWLAHSQYATSVARGERSLAVIVQEHSGRWHVLAFETSVAASAASLAAVLGDHGHKIVGDYDVPSAAFAAAEAYARAWVRRSRTSRVVGCACPTIA